MSPSGNPAPARRRRIALMGTFNQPCAIAAHTAAMRDGLLAASRERGLELDVIVLAEETQRTLGPDPDGVHRCWSRRGRDLVRALDVLTDEGVEVLHLQLHGPLFTHLDLPGFLAGCRASGIQTFASVHFLEERAHEVAKAINLVDRAFVHGEEGAARFGAHGAHAHRLAVLPLGISRPAIAANLATVRQALDLPEDLELVTACGSFAPEEGVLEILDALQPVVARHPHLQFAFLSVGETGAAGREDYIATCREHAVALGLGNNVTLPDATLSEDELSPYLAAADVVILNDSVERPGTLHRAAFVLAHGRPVISNAAGVLGMLEEFTLPAKTGAVVSWGLNRMLEQVPYAAQYEKRAAACLESSFHRWLGGVLLGEYGFVPRHPAPSCVSAREVIEAALHGLAQASAPAACEPAAALRVA